MLNLSYELNYNMGEVGYAWWYEYYYGDNKILENPHNQAKKQKSDLWAGSNAINPYQ